jgi:glycosyltransferase involved in cell wall biosynthesis
MPNLSLKGIWLLFFNPFKTWVVSHNVWYDGYNSKTEFTAKIKLALLFFCRNISVSKAVAESIPAKSIVIHNAYDRNTFHQNYPTNRSKKLLYVGRLVSDKGVDDLIIAFVQLLTKYPTLSLTIVGDGEERIKIEELVNHYQLQSNIELTGTLKNEVLASVMNAHEVLVVPSKWNEPFGIVALEGLACGCKVVCSNGGGLKEAVGAFGFLFTNGKVDELINVIEQALQTTNNNWNEIDKFLAIHNIEYVAQKYLDVFK